MNKQKPSLPERSPRSSYQKNMSKRKSSAIPITTGRRRSHITYPTEKQRLESVKEANKILKEKKINSLSSKINETCLMKIKGIKPECLESINVYTQCIKNKGKPKAIVRGRRVRSKSGGGESIQQFYSLDRLAEKNKKYFSKNSKNSKNSKRLKKIRTLQSRNTAYFNKIKTERQSKRLFKASSKKNKKRKSKRKRKRKRTKKKK
tara:strand:- start:32 stop:646 length:615 start_codon:yes stop_codon:yes gene_type:complete